MASEQLKKMFDIVRSQQAGGASEPTVEQLCAGMEKVAARVEGDVHCEPVTAGGVKAEWVVPPGADTRRVRSEEFRAEATFESRLIDGQHPLTGCRSACHLRPR